MTLEIQYNDDGTINYTEEIRIRKDHKRRVAGNNAIDRHRRHNAKRSGLKIWDWEWYKAPSYLRPIKGNRGGRGDWMENREPHWELDRNWEGIDDWESLPVVKVAPKKERKDPMRSWWAVYTVCKDTMDDTGDSVIRVHCLPEITSDWYRADWMSTKKIEVRYQLYSAKGKYHSVEQFIVVYLGKHRQEPARLQDVSEIQAKAEALAW